VYTEFFEKHSGRQPDLARQRAARIASGDDRRVVEAQFDGPTRR
jgi:hypothetical protein